MSENRWQSLIEDTDPKNDDGADLVLVWDNTSKIGSKKLVEARLCVEHVLETAQELNFSQQHAYIVSMNAMNNNITTVFKFKSSTDAIDTENYLNERLNDFVGTGIEAANSCYFALEQAS